jgi:hypothetical protein
MKRKIVVTRPGGLREVLFVESVFEDGTLSCSDISMRFYFLVRPDGFVESDHLYRNLFGVVSNWDYIGEA